MNEAVPVDDGRCFACGPFNAEGLHLRFAPAGDASVRAEITLPPRFQSSSPASRNDPYVNASFTLTLNDGRPSPTCSGAPFGKTMLLLTISETERPGWIQLTTMPKGGTGSELTTL